MLLLILSSTAPIYYLNTKCCLIAKDQKHKLKQTEVEYKFNGRTGSRPSLHLLIRVSIIHK